MQSMVDHRKCFQFEGLPVIPGNFKADTWIIYSPFLMKRVEVTGRESFDNSLKERLISKHDNFFANPESPNKAPVITELYITKNTNYSNIKKSIFYSINKFLAENTEKIQFNIVTSSVDEYIDDILKVINLIDKLSKELVKPEVILTTSGTFSVDLLRNHKEKISSLHFQVEDSKPIDLCQVIQELKNIIEVSVSFYVNKLNVYEVESFIHCCIEHGIKNVNIEPVKTGSEVPLKEVYVLNLLKGIKASLKSNINSNILNQLKIGQLSNRTDNCCNCFAQSLCKSDSDFQCYVTRNTVPSLIKCS